MGLLQTCNRLINRLNCTTCMNRRSRQKLHEDPDSDSDSCLDTDSTTNGQPLIRLLHIRGAPRLLKVDPKYDEGLIGWQRSGVSRRGSDGYCRPWWQGGGGGGGARHLRGRHRSRERPCRNRGGQARNTKVLMVESKGCAHQED